MPYHFAMPVETAELPRPLASHCKECTTKTLSAEKGAPTSCVPAKATPDHFKPKGVEADAAAMNPKPGTSGPKAMPQTTVTPRASLPLHPGDALGVSTCWALSVRYRRREDATVDAPA